jgi:hypothetical protein
LQSSHPYRAAVGAPPHHQAPVEHHGPGDVAALGFAALLIVAVPLFAMFVMYRAFRWFFRATR